MSAGSPALELVGVSKAFSGVSALRGVDFSVGSGEVRALVGANGAGKSTLIKIVAGVHRPDSGRLLIGGRERRFRSPLEAFEAGVSVVHQETSLVPTATAVQNVFLGRERLRGPLLDERRMLELYGELASRLGVAVPPDRRARELGAAEKKLVEIMKACARESSILVLDEPTDSLSRREIDALFRVVCDLRARGMTVVYITHFLGEVAAIADGATVLRDGEVVATRPARGLATAEIVALMLGREPARRERSAARPAGAAPRLEARGLSRRGEFRDVSFELREGEVLGVLGVVGSGKTELARAVSGATRLHGGELYARGRPVDARDPRRAAAAGIGMAPEDRKAHGLVIDMELYKNVSLASLGRMSRRGIIRAALERSEVERVAKALGTKYASLSQRARCLSGGNQQKLVLARWLLASPDVLVLDEPTRGVDVGAKAEIYGIVRRLALEGKSVLYLSGEAQEMLEVADRVMVMQRGRVVATHEEPPSEDELLAEMLEVADGR